jgi:hypothetical protein
MCGVQVAQEDGRARVKALLLVALLTMTRRSRQQRPSWNMAQQKTKVVVPLGKALATHFMMGKGVVLQLMGDTIMVEV